MKSQLLEPAKKCIAGVANLFTKTGKRSMNLISGLAAAVALVATNGNIGAAARSILVAPSTIYRRIVATSRDLESETGNYRQKPGPKERMTKSRQKELVAFIKSTRPCEVGLGTLHWDAGLVAYIIDFFFGKKISESTIKRILRRGGLSYKRTEIRNIRRDEVNISFWQRTIAPELLADDYTNNRHPVFLDESGVSSQSNRFEGWSAKGERSIAPQGDRFIVNLIGCIGIFGESHFLMSDGTIDSDFVIAFLESLRLKYPNIKFSVYLDGAKFHWSNKIKAYLSQNDWVRFNKLPAYAPEINPIELLWADLKNNYLKRIDRLKRDTFLKGIEQAIVHISKGVRSIEKYWHARELQYIADSFQVFNRGRLQVI
jgi:transposase